MKYFIIFISFLLANHLAYGQIIQKTERRAVNKTNQRIDSKIDRGLDTDLYALERIFSTTKSQKETTEYADVVEYNESESQEVVLAGNEQVQGSYEFDHNVLLNIESYDRKGKAQDPMDLRIYFSDDKPNFGMEMNMNQSNTIVIYDMKTHQMVSLINNDGQKMGTALKFNPEKFEKALTKSTKDEERTYNFVKTGNTQTISGFSCDEYKLESTPPDTEWNHTYWITDKMNASWTEYMAKLAANNKTMANKMEVLENYPQGTIIQVVSESQKNKEKTVMTVKDFNKDQSKIISTSDYEIMTMPSFGGN